MKYIFTNTAREFCERDSGYTPGQLISLLENEKYVNAGSRPEGAFLTRRVLVCDPERERFTVVVLDEREKDDGRIVIVTLYRQESIEHWNGRPLPMKWRYQAAEKVMTPAHLEDWKRRDRYRGLLEGQAAKHERIAIAIYDQSGHRMATPFWASIEIRMTPPHQIPKLLGFWRAVLHSMRYHGIAEWFDSIGQIRAEGSKGLAITLWRRDGGCEIPDISLLENEPCQAQA